MARLNTPTGADMTPEMLDALLEKVADRFYAEARPALLARQRAKTATRAAEAAAGNVVRLDDFRARRGGGAGSRRAG